MGSFALMKICAITQNSPGSNLLSLYLTVVLAADQSNARSILLYQTNLDKITPLTSHSAMGVSGPNCDMVNFTE